MTMPDLDALEALARAATPGRWQTSTSPTTHNVRTTDEWGRVGRHIAVCVPGPKTGTASIGLANAAYIAAAHPAKLLELIAELRGYRERAQAAKDFDARLEELCANPAPPTQALIAAYREYRSMIDDGGLPPGTQHGEPCPTCGASS